MQAFHVYTFEQVAMGSVDAIRSLLEGGVCPDIVDDTVLHDSALHWACSFGNVEVATLLLEHGGDVNITNANGETCLHAACKAGNEDFVNLLLQHGVDVSARDVSGKLAMEYLPEDADDLRELMASTLPTLRPPPPPFPAPQGPSSSPPDPSHTPTPTAHVPSPNETCLHSAMTVTASSASSEHSSGYDTDSGGESEGPGPGTSSRPLHPRPRGGSFLPREVSSQQIILWPPAQRQVQYSSPSPAHPPLRLSSAVPVVIASVSGGIDVYPLLTWSGLVDTFDRMGLAAQVQRGSAQAQVTLSINQDVCPGRHRFEIRIGELTDCSHDLPRLVWLTLIADSNAARLTASDTTGLLYATYAFIQILTLHAEVSRTSSLAARANGAAEATAVGLEVPAMVIVDWPDIPDRAVLWSYRSTVRTQSGAMKRTVRLLSSLRINQLYLGVDRGDGTGAAPHVQRPVRVNRCNSSHCTRDCILHRLVACSD